MVELTGPIKKTADEFLVNMKEAFGDELRSVVLYGPAARWETSRQPYINFMVTVEDNTPSEIARCSKYLKDWRKKLIAMPLFLTPDYVGKSLDTFPLEFMDIVSAYSVVYGDNPLEGIEFRPAHVRAECEREIKGKLLHLRAEYLDLRGDAKGLVDLVGRSLATFRLLFMGALYLKDIEIPEETDALFDAVIDAYGLDGVLFRTLFTVSKKRKKIDGAVADDLFDKYVEEIEKLSHEIDFMFTT